MELPEKIEPCPIIDALVEVRFSSKINPEAVFGLIYNRLKDDFPGFQKLPILELPEQVRSNDPSLKFKPYYKLSNQDYVIQIGPRVLVIGSYPEYTGWNNFSDELFKVISNVLSLDIIADVERIGLRYINFFKEDLLHKIKLKVEDPNQNDSTGKLNIRTNYLQESVKLNLVVSNTTVYNNKEGTLIDIDSSIDFPNVLNNFEEEYDKLINLIHTKEKTLFFSLLNKDFVDELKS
ncbi:MAG: TIGR04255 family protein [Psychroflexus halocasei]